MIVPSPRMFRCRLSLFSTDFHWVPPAQETASDNQRCRSTCGTWNPPSPETGMSHSSPSRKWDENKRRNSVPSNMYNINIYIYTYGALFFPRGSQIYIYIYMCIYINCIHTYMYVYIYSIKRETERVSTIVTLVRIVCQCLPIHYYISIK